MEKFLATYFPIIIIIVVLYFMVFLPESKRKKEYKKMLETLKKGDKVQTIGGIIGTIEGFKDNRVFLKVDKNTTMEILRTAIASVINKKEQK